MNEDKTTVQKSFEELLTKSMEAGKVFISEGTRIARDFGRNENVLKPGAKQQELLSRTFSEYVKLNVRHVNNLIDLGLDFMRNFRAGAPAERQEPASDEPSFTLEVDAAPGETGHLQFVLDNTKPDTVDCQLMYSDFRLKTDNSLHDFPIQFSPQSFELNPGESMPVGIAVTVPDHAVPGVYAAKVQVKGFEPSFIAILLNVSERKA